MLYEVILAGSMLSGVGQQFLHHVKLMVSREDNFYLTFASE
jgi:hypothetical protein